MNEKLKDLYYRDDVIIGSKQNFITIAKKSLNASTKEINEFLSKQELNQVNKKPTRHTNLKITAPPKSFQIDIMYYPIGEGFKNVLLIVDIQSSKAEAYVLSKTTGDNILKAYKEFISDPDILEYTTDRLRNDEDIILNILEKNKNTWDNQMEYICDNLKNDKNFVIKTIKINY